MYDCSILKCSHNKNGICLAEYETECTDYPNAEYFATDQLLNANKCHKYRKQMCKGCPDASYCPEYAISYEDWLVNNYADILFNDALDQIEKD